MLSRFILAVVIGVLAVTTASACDACGCSIMGQPNGLLANYRKSFLSAGYGHASFVGTPGTGEGATDQFHALDLSFDYYFSSRWRAGAFLPYRINTRTADGISQQVQGISDLRLDVNYTFLRQERNAAGWEVYLEGGVGAVFPSGKYNPDIHDSDLPENFNPGKGSFGYTLQQTSGISYKSVGTVIRNSWTDFGPTADGYQYGSQWVTSCLFLVNLPLDSTISFVPLGSIQFEKIWNDQYVTGADVHGTGGYGVFLTPGGQIKINNWLLTVQYAVPLTADYSSGEVKAGNRLSLQMTHLF